MSAPKKENSLDNNAKIKKLAVIAGGGSLPERLLQACDQAGLDIFVVGFEDQTNMDLLQGRAHLVTRLGAGGQIIETLRTHGFADIVMIGSIRRPSLKELRPDLRTAKFFTKVGLKALGDDGLLKALRNELEGEGFTIHGVQDFVTDLLVGKGAVGSHKPKKKDWADIQRGVAVAKEMGALDIGQALIVQEGLILGVEAIEGTDELIKRCAAYCRKGRGGILVKLAKPEQDQNLDLPTIGPDTALLCAQAGMEGIILHAGHGLLLEPAKVAAIADEHKMFVWALDPQEDILTS